MDKLAIGIDVGGTNIKAGLVDSLGRVTHFSKTPTNAKEGFNKTYISIKKLIEKYISVAGRENIVGIGCSCTGQIDHLSGRVVYAAKTFPELSGFELEKEIQGFSRFPVEVENDVNAWALGEKWIGSARDIEDFICITLGTGVGGAIYRNGGLDRGYKGIAAEFGHIGIDINGEECSCGSRGCFERYASVSAFIRHFKEELLKGNKSLVIDMVNGNIDSISGEVIYKAKSMGDALALKAVEKYQEYIIYGTLALIYSLNPKAVIIGGGITALGDEFINPIRDGILSRVMPSFGEGLIVKGAELGDNAAICGISRKLFKDLGGR